MKPRRRSFRHKLFLTLEGGSRDYLPSLIFDWAMLLLIVANVVAFAAETVPSIAREWRTHLSWFNDISLGVFTVEYVLRLWVAIEHPMVRHRGPVLGRMRYALQPLMLVDLAVILPFYLAFFLPINASALRVVRLLRFIKLARFSPALSTLGHVIVNERRALASTAILLLGVAAICATALYATEGDIQPDKFGSVPEAMWWAVTTLTTVGYGDVVPVTPVGKLIGGFVMLLGVMLVALPVGVLANGYVQEIRRRDFAITWGMVARVPFFARLDAGSFVEIMRILQSRTFGRGEIIVEEGDEAESMYFVLSGTVELMLPGKTVQLGEGDFFGEISLLKKVRRMGTAAALARSELLLLHADDFKALLKRRPALRARIMETVDAYFADEVEAAKGDVL